MDSERGFIRRELSKPHLRQFFANITFCSDVKNSQRCIEAREHGNRLFKRPNHSVDVHRQILDLYSKSVAFAPDATEELALAYGNRSALLLHLKLYEQSIRDIHKALAITKSNVRKVKFLCRKVECLTALGSPENQAAFGKAMEIFDQISDNDAEKESLANTVKKSKIILDANKAKPLPTEDESKRKFLEEASEKERAGALNFLEIRYSKEKGRHLVASRDFEPGEIIFAERPYAFISNACSPYIYCEHCLTVAWTGVPCKSCNWCIFCSEKCRDEAWKSYHNIECSFIPYMVKNIRKLNELAQIPGHTLASHECMQNFYSLKQTIRILILGIKEAGSIDKLKAELASIDNCKDKRTRGFSENGKFESDKFRSIYSLSHHVPDSDLAPNVTMLAMALACAARQSSLFGTKSFSDKSLADLANDKEFIFVGALLLRIFKICDINSLIFKSETEMTGNNESKSSESKSCGTETLRGTYLAAISSLLSNSCCPNAKKFHTENQEIAFYALEPIKKGTELTMSFFGYFYNTPEFIDRRDNLRRTQYFTCHCEACENNWPPVMNKSYLMQTFGKYSPAERQLFTEYIDAITSAQCNDENYNATLIPKLASGIKKGSELLPQPSLFRCMLMQYFQCAFIDFYGNHLPFDRC